MRAVGLVVVAMLLTGSAAQATSGSPVPTALRGNLTAREYDVAVRVAAQQTRAQHAHVTSAWAEAVPDTHPYAAGNTGHPCRSATVLKVRLLGSFPHIVVSPPPGATPEQTRVTALTATADLDTGEACLIGVSTGPQRPGAGWTRLPS